MAKQKLVKVNFKIEGTPKSLMLKQGASLSDLLEKIGFTSETMLITVDGKVALPSSKIPKGEIELFKVVSGG